MPKDILLYIGSIAITLWGAGHLAPTRSIVRGFGTLAEDNRRIITMEWIAEGLTLCFIGLLTGILTFSGWSASPAAIAVYRACAAMLLAMAGLSLLTGARTSILPMKLCPLVKTAVACLFLLATT